MQRIIFGETKQYMPIWYFNQQTIKTNELDVIASDVKKNNARLMARAFCDSYHRTLTIHKPLLLSCVTLWLSHRSPWRGGSFQFKNLLCSHLLRYAPVNSRISINHVGHVPQEIMFFSTVSILVWQQIDLWNHQQTRKWAISPLIP